jgi:transposase
MKKILKQVVGIDIAQKELVVCLGRMDDSIASELYARQVFVNSKKGFAALLAWVKKHTDTELAVQYVMEATGVYHESLAYFLYDQECSLTIVLPSKISNYARTLDVKTVTDKTASEAITRFGLERKLDDWKRPSPVLKKLRQLTRERDQLVQQRTIAKNQLHAENAEAEPNQSTIKRTTALINMMNKQEKEIRAEITLLIKSNEELKSWITRLCTIPGIGQLTAATILAETNGFELIRNKKQLVSYAGLDVREKQSGTSVKGKARISKKGNKFLRKAMHLPALTAIRHDERFKAIFARSVAKHGIKMKAVVPIQRKLLEMAYILFKNETVYDKEYLQREVEKELLVLKN